MKKMSLKWMLLTLLSCSFVFFACSKDDDNNDPQPPEKATLSVSTPATGLEFEAVGGTQTVTITTNQTEWTAALETVADTAWCKLSQNDKVLTVEVVANPSEEARSGKIKLVAGSGDNTATAEIVVGQSLPAATLTLDPNTSLEFETGEDFKTVTVTTNRSTWTAVLTDVTDTTWCKLTQVENVLTVKVLKNTTAERDAEITVTAGSSETGKSLTIAVKQKFEALPTYELFDVYDKDGVKGIVFELNEDKTSGKIMSLTGYNNDFRPSGGLKDMGSLADANSEADGIHNTEKIKEYATNWNEQFPCIAWAEDMNKNGVTGWHIPAKNDALKIWSLYTTRKAELNGALTSAGGEGMLDGYYSAKSGNPYEYVFCSSTLGVYDGWGAVWGTGYTNNTLTESTSKIRSLCEFDASTYQFRAIRKF